jgi:uncharacterized protein YkwD
MAITPTTSMSMAGMTMPMNSTSGGGTAAAKAAPTPSKVSQDAMQMGGGCGGAVGGVAQLTGGGGADMAGLAGVLNGVVQAISKLVEALKGMVAGGGPTQTAVKGMSGNTAQVPAQSTTQAAPAKAVNFSSNGVEQNAYEQRVLELVNAERAKAGLAPVKYNAALDAAATEHNVQQVNTRTMAHINIGDGDPGSRIRAEGWRGSWGENVAVGQRTPEQVVQEWMASPTHRANILNPNYQYMGVSYNSTADGHAFWAQEFGG